MTVITTSWFLQMLYNKAVVTYSIWSRCMSTGSGFGMPWTSFGSCCHGLFVMKSTRPPPTLQLMPACSNRQDANLSTIILYTTVQYQATNFRFIGYFWCYFEFGRIPPKHKKMLYIFSVMWCPRGTLKFQSFWSWSELQRCFFAQPNNYQTTVYQITCIRSVLFNDVTMILQFHQKTQKAIHHLSNTILKGLMLEC